MGGPRHDVSGQSFGRLTVLSWDESAGRWLTQCECGTTKLVRTYSLRKGEVVSCGCFRRSRFERQRKLRAREPLLGQLPCHKCARWLPVDSFAHSSRTICGRQGRCRDCAYAYSLMKQHRIDWDIAFALVLAKKDASCAACGRQDDLHIDHCHDTGKIRGFLCGNCNRALGLLGDDILVIGRLAAYAGGVRNVSASCVLAGATGDAVYDRRYEL